MSVLSPLFGSTVKLGLGWGASAVGGSSRGLAVVIGAGAGVARVASSPSNRAAILLQLLERHKETCHVWFLFSSLNRMIRIALSRIACFGILV